MTISLCLFFSFPLEATITTSRYKQLARGDHQIDRVLQHENGIREKSLSDTLLYLVSMAASDEEFIGVPGAIHIPPNRAVIISLLQSKPGISITLIEYLLSQNSMKLLVSTTCAQPAEPSAFDPIQLLKCLLKILERNDAEQLLESNHQHIRRTKEQWWHSFVTAGNVDALSKLLHPIQQDKVMALLRMTNNKGQTALHLSVMANAGEEMVQFIAEQFAVGAP